MHNGDTSIKKPRDHWEQACDFFETMLDDFRSKNLLRKNIDKSERERLNLVWENSRKYEIALNNLFNRFSSVGMDAGAARVDFDKKCAAVGSPKDTVNYLIFSQLIGTFLLKLEALFRTSLLFFLEEREGIRRHDTLRELLKKIKKISPPIGKELNNLINTDLRNHLAHGTFWFQGNTLFHAENSYLEESTKMPLGKLMFENLKMNLITNALVHTLKQKEEHGYFES